MTFTKRAAASVAALAVLATPVAVQAGPEHDAEAVRKLDIMLMVTSLRCRRTADNFQADYQAFSANNLGALNAASKALQADLLRQGNTGKRALDQMSTSMANEYGNGHPWLGCGELKRIAQELSSGRDAVQLAAAAGDLLSSGPRGQFAMLGKR